MLRFFKKIFYVVLLSMLIVWINQRFLSYRNQSIQTLNTTISPFVHTTQPPSSHINSNLNYKQIANVITLNLLHSNEFEIDRGRIDGVSYGSLVTNHNGHVLGVVNQVDENRSVVRKITDSEIKLGVWVNKPTNKGLLSGRYGYSAQVDWLQDGSDLINQPVYTSNISQSKTEGLYVGRVQDITLGKSGSFYTADLHDLAGLSDTYGFVLVW